MTDHQHSPLSTPPLLLENERLDTVNEDIRLIQNVNGLTFGTDAFLLAAFVRPSPASCAVDLGSGTGILPLLLLAKKKIRSATAVEIQPLFADLIRRNAALNGFDGQIRCLCRDVRSLSPKDIGGEAELVISNPPYMKCESGKRNERDEKYIARHEVCGDIADFCASAARLLKYGGRFACVWRPDRLADLFSALRAASLEPKRMVMVHADEASEPSAVLVEALKGGASSMRILPPLFLYLPQREGERSRTLTPRARKIYDSCSFFD